MSTQPNDAGHLCLSFDFDGPSLWIQRQQTTPTSVSRGEFGAVAIPRILKLLALRGIPATFFIPGHTIESYPDECRLIAEGGHEIALHGYAHELNARLGPDEEAAILDRSIELVTAVAGDRPRGYRAPSGEVTDQTLELLISRELLYDSSLMGHDYQPYQVRIGNEFPPERSAQWGRQTELVELPWSWTVDDYVYLEFVTFRRMLMPGLKRPDDMFANFADDVRWMVRELEAGVLTTVFHPQVIGRGHRLLALERWIDDMLSLGIQFDRMDHIAQAHAAGVTFGADRPL